MTKELADIIRENSHLLNRKYLDDFYASIPKWKRGEVTKCLMELGVSPLERLYNLPTAVYYEITGVESISIPDTVTEISDAAFKRMSDLKGVAIPTQVSKIEDYAFSDCRDLSDVVFQSTGKLHYIGHNAFALTNLSKVVVPGTVSSIGSGAFYWCRNLKEVVFTEGLIGIDDSVFVECTNLSYVSLPSTLDYIGSFAFAACKKLDKLHYSGNKSEFESIMQKFPRNWAYQSQLNEVLCLDGILKLEDNLKIRL